MSQRSFPSAWRASFVVNHSHLVLMDKPTEADALKWLAQERQKQVSQGAKFVSTGSVWRLSGE